MARLDDAAAILMTNTGRQLHHESSDRQVTLLPGRESLPNLRDVTEFNSASYAFIILCGSIRLCHEGLGLQI